VGIVGDQNVEDVHGGDADLEVVVIGEIQHSLYDNLGDL
jgi:hypothetical protein